MPFLNTHLNSNPKTLDPLVQRGTYAPQAGGRDRCLPGPTVPSRSPALSVHNGQLPLACTNLISITKQAQELWPGDNISAGVAAGCLGAVLQGTWARLVSLTLVYLH